MFRPEIKNKIEVELARGAAARAEGFEGRARVCARRAAGAAVREYLEIKDLPLPGPGAYDLLAYLHDMPALLPQIKLAVERLLLRVDEDFALPGDVDLLADARLLADTLENLV